MAGPKDSLQPNQALLKPSSVDARPNLLRAATTKAMTTSTDQPNEATPLMSRPMMNRTTSAATVLQGTDQRASITKKTTRPSLLRRATDKFASALEIPNNAADKPPPPSHWTDHSHRKALLQTWDTVSELAAQGKYARSIVSQLVSTEKRMLERYSELGEGEVTLTREWVEYVLGICMRHPFCTSETMGRWRVLASSGGARGNWGPF